VFFVLAMCGVASCLVFKSQSAEVSRTVTSSFVWSWRSVLTLLKGPKIPRVDSIQLICISIIHCLCTINSCTFDVGIIVCAACPTYCECVLPAQLTASACCLPNLLRVHAACPTYCECVLPTKLIASTCCLPNLLRVFAACPTYCECVLPAQLIAIVCCLPNYPS
jgi:hypothetical protein